VTPAPSGGIDLGAWGTSLIAEIAAAKDIATLDPLEAEHAPNIDAAPPAVAKALRDAFAARRKAIEDGE
jgi:hypothetical protein